MINEVTPSVWKAVEPATQLRQNARLRSTSKGHRCRLPMIAPCSGSIVLTELNPRVRLAVVRKAPLSPRVRLAVGRKAPLCRTITRQRSTSNGRRCNNPKPSPCITVLLHKPIERIGACVMAQLFIRHGKHRAGVEPKWLRILVCCHTPHDISLWGFPQERQFPNTEGILSTETRDRNTVLT